MLLEISKFSKYNKKNWDLKYSNFEFDKILELIIRNLEYEYIEMLIWTFQLNLFNDIKYSVDGGYDNAERKVIFIYPYYMEYEDIECPLEIVQVEGNFKFKEISHKDYLGAILNLGIVREKIGDIIIHENF